MYFIQHLDKEIFNDFVEWCQSVEPNGGAYTVPGNKLWEFFVFAAHMDDLAAGELRYKELKDFWSKRAKKEDRRPPMMRVSGLTKDLTQWLQVMYVGDHMWYRQVWYCWLE